MGRTEPTIVKPPAAFRRDARAKRARATLNKVIPAMLTAHPRVRQGVERSELVVDPPALLPLSSDGKRRDAAGGSADVKTSGRRKKTMMMEDNQDDEKLPHGEQGANRSVPGATHDPPRITLYVGDALSAAQALLSHSTSQQNQNQKHQRERKGSVNADAFGRRYKKVGILNMASPLAPGGGFLNGATGPEASLCLRTTLLPALRDEFYRLPELGVVYTPDVLVFRPTSSPGKRDGISGSEGKGEKGGSIEDDDILPKNDRWFIDVASAAMLRLPETMDEDEDGRTAYASASDRALAERKMRAVLRVFAARGCEAVVLGAWGCGPHEGNPVSEIAAAWRRVLGVEVGHHSEDYDSLAQKSGERGDKGAGKEGGGKSKKKTSRNKEREKRGEPWGAYISDIIFAIKDRGTATSFARAFGEEYIAASSSSASISSPSATTGDSDEEDPVEVARVSELREKIAELEVQAAQVRSPHLKVGLESVLAGLRKQLPPVSENDDGSGNEDDDDDDDDDDGVSSSGQGQDRSSETDEDEDD
ncbi:hypothetical protein F4860DRAFT_389933 [Xylaria cubensis]|nr:hypothetical protein F4860DRAFT_389933 [Xylaria cubensis]